MSTHNVTDLARYKVRLVSGGRMSRLRCLLCDWVSEPWRSTQGQKLPRVTMKLAKRHHQESHQTALQKAIRQRSSPR